jgi:MFS family permease
MRTLFRLRNARIYLLGDVVSTAGDNSLWLAVGIWVKELTGSSAWAGLVMFCFVVGGLFAPLGGMLADRFARRKLLITLNLISIPLVLLLLLVHGRSMIWLVYLVTFAYGLVGSAAGPAETALLPAIVPADLLAEANGAQQTLNEGLRLITPLLGAALFAWAGVSVVVLLEVATFVVAAASLAALRIGDEDPATDTTEQAPPDESDAKSAGFRFLAGEPVLRSITLTLAIALLAMGFTESAAFSVVTTGLHHSASFVGVLITVQGVGAVTGGLLAAPALKRTSSSLLIVAGLGCVAIATALLTVPNLIVCLAAMLVAGLVGPCLVVAAMTAVQTRTPARLLGRVAGVFQLSLALPMTISIGLGALLIAVVSYQVLLLVVTAVALVAAGYLLSVPETRRPAAPAAAATLAADIVAPDASAAS